MHLAVALIRAGRALVRLAERVAPEITAKPEKRLAAAYRRRHDGQDTAGTFTTNVSSTSNNGWAAVSVVIG